MSIWESSISKTLIYYHLEYSRYDFYYFVAFELWIHWIFFLDCTTEYSVGSRMKWINIIKFKIATFKQKKIYIRIYRAVDKKSDFITLLQSDYGKIIGEMNVDTQCAWDNQHAFNFKQQKTWAKPITHNDAYNNNFLFGFFSFSVRFFYSSSHGNHKFMHSKIYMYKKEKSHSAPTTQNHKIWIHWYLKNSAFSYGVAQDFNFPSLYDVSLCNLHIAIYAVLISSTRFCTCLCACVFALSALSSTYRPPHPLFDANFTLNVSITVERTECTRETKSMCIPLSIHSITLSMQRKLLFKTIDIGLQCAHAILL